MRYTLITKYITQTIWFESFVRGLELRVGRNSMLDQAIIIEVIKLLMNNMEVVVKGRFQCWKGGT